MAERKPVPTMKDVAREAGVALGTVSKVVNGLPVGEEYRTRVNEAIIKLDYRINSYAKGLKATRTNTVAVLMPNLINPFFTSLVSAIGRALAAKGCRMLVYETDYDPGMEQANVILAEQQKVDGIICLSYNQNLKVSDGVTLISIDRYFGTRIPCVASDNYGGGRLAAEKLIENGCRHLAFLRIGTKLTNEPNKRKDGFVSACEAAEIDYTLKIVDDGTPYSDFADFLREHYRAGKLDFDGIFCVTDSMAYLIKKMITEMGLRVPEDVQIVGYDGVQMFGDLDYTCSTIVQPVQAMAETCVDMVLNPDGAKNPSLVCLPVSYAYGGTTKA